MEIKKATVSDVPRLVKFFITHKDLFLPPLSEHDIVTKPREFAHSIETGKREYFYAEENREILGAIGGLEKPLPEKYNPGLHQWTQAVKQMKLTHGWMYLEIMLVDPNIPRRGIGSALMEHWLRYMYGKNYHIFWTETWFTNFGGTNQKMFRLLRKYDWFGIYGFPEKRPGLTVDYTKDRRGARVTNVFIKIMR